MKYLRETLVFSTLTALSVPASAQELVEPMARQGYYLSGAVYSVLDANFDDQRWYKGWPGVSGGLRLGQALFSWLDIGLSIDFGWATGTKRQAIFGGLSLEGQAHPWEGLGVRVGVGFGVLSAGEIEPEESDEALGGVGDYYTLGVSYDFFPFYDGGSGGLAISPVIQMRVLPRNNFNALMGWVGIELTYWAGLPNNQLVLPLEEAFSAE